jgi:predicted ATPase
MARPAPRRGNLPAEATSFIGRRHELAEVRTRLAGARVVTLVGPGGVGKTRLAVRAAAAVVRGFPDGTWYVELAGISDPPLVVEAVLGALDLRGQVAAEPGALLRSHLRERRLLLVLDNCEHLLEAVAPLVAAVVAGAAGVRVLATSREPLAVPGEHLVPVPPLETTDEAVALFAERAAAASGGFTLTAGNRPAVAEVCRRLDGLPLAIELAAVRTRVLSPAQILARLDDRFALLTAGSRTALPRQQTLRTAIDWSHDLLNEPERTLLRRLHVFAGRFTADDALAVCGATLDELSSLVDKSLVIPDRTPHTATERTAPDPQNTRRTAPRNARRTARRTAQRNAR